MEAAPGGGFKQYYTDDGIPYYFDAATGRSMWAAPSDWMCTYGANNALVFRNAVTQQVIYADGHADAAAPSASPHAIPHEGGRAVRRPVRGANDNTRALHSHGALASPAHDTYASGHDAPHARMVRGRGGFSTNAGAAGAAGARAAWSYDAAGVAGEEDDESRALDGVGAYEHSGPQAAAVSKREKRLRAERAILESRRALSEPLHRRSAPHELGHGAEAEADAAATAVAQTGGWYVAAVPTRRLRHPSADGDDIEPDTSSLRHQYAPGVGYAGGHAAAWDAYSSYERGGAGSRQYPAHTAVYASPVIDDAYEEDTDEEDEEEFDAALLANSGITSLLPSFCFSSRRGFCRPEADDDSPVAYRAASVHAGATAPAAPEFLPDDGEESARYWGSMDADVAASDAARQFVGMSLDERVAWVRSVLSKFGTHMAANTQLVAAYLTTKSLPFISSFVRAAHGSGRSSLRYITSIVTAAQDSISPVCELPTSLRTPMRAVSAPSAVSQQRGFMATVSTALDWSLASCARGAARATDTHDTPSPAASASPQSKRGHFSSHWSATGSLSARSGAHTETDYEAYLSAVSPPALSPTGGAVTRNKRAHSDSAAMNTFDQRSAARRDAGQPPGGLVDRLFARSVVDRLLKPSRPASSSTPPPAVPARQEGADIEQQLAQASLQDEEAHSVNASFVSLQSLEVTPSSTPARAHAQAAARTLTSPPPSLPPPTQLAVGAAGSALRLGGSTVLPLPPMPARSGPIGSGLRTRLPPPTTSYLTPPSLEPSQAFTHAAAHEQGVHAARGGEIAALVHETTSPVSRHGIVGVAELRARAATQHQQASPTQLASPTLGRVPGRPPAGPSPASPPPFFTPPRVQTMDAKLLPHSTQSVHATSVSHTPSSTDSMMQSPLTSPTLEQYGGMGSLTSSAQPMPVDVLQEVALTPVGMTHEHRRAQSDAQPGLHSATGASLQEDAPLRCNALGDFSGHHHADSRDLDWGSAQAANDEDDSTHAWTDNGRDTLAPRAVGTPRGSWTAAAMTSTRAEGAHAPAAASVWHTLDARAAALDATTAAGAHQAPRAISPVLSHV